MAFATKKDALNWAKAHLMPTKYGNFYDPIEGLETRPEKTPQGYWRFEGRNDEWLYEIEKRNAQGGQP